MELFASIRFNESRFGGELDDKIQFTLTLENAQLVIIPDESGNLNIPNATVRRDQSEALVASETTQASSKEATADMSANAELSLVKVKAGAKAIAEAKAAMSAAKTQTMKQSHRGIISEHAHDGEHHRWLFRPAMGEVLVGHGWADKSPILKLRHTEPASIGSEPFPPYVKVQVKCLATDLNIANVQYLDKSNLWQPFAAGKKLGLAKELIKVELQNEGLLQVPKADLDLDRENTLLLVADIIAVKELPNG